jgi:predicted Zn-dependent protease
MVIRRPHVALALLALAFAATLPVFASRAPSIKRSKSDRDINAIGHRDIAHEQDRKFIGSLALEEQRGAAWAAVVERSTKLVDDPALKDYLAELAQHLAQNSDAQMPITVTLVDSDEVQACTSPGGYQYVTRGLLLQLESEGELAAVLAHGIAHTALHTPTIKGIRQALMHVTVPGPVPDSAFTWFMCTTPPSLIWNAINQVYEFDADYFGVQYLYKAGYDPDCNIRFVERVWPAGSLSGKAAVTINYVPATSERLKALRSEFADILPQRGEGTLSTSAFEQFEQRLHTWQAQHPEPHQPFLRRAETAQ